MKTKSTIAFAVAAAALSGCFSSTLVLGPRGKPALALSCPSASRCWEEAAKACPYGYTVDDRAVLQSEQVEMLVECNR